MNGDEPLGLDHAQRVAEGPDRHPGQGDQLPPVETKRSDRQPALQQHLEDPPISEVAQPRAFSQGGDGFPWNFTSQAFPLRSFNRLTRHIDISDKNI